jgi:small-conductance mechanosensitive channel
MGVNVTALVASLGLSGFALGFAARDMLSNLLGGMLILFYHPFRRGDRISVAGSEGIVRQINLRYTLLDCGDRQILIPNSILLNTQIILMDPPPSA